MELKNTEKLEHSQVKLTVAVSAEWQGGCQSGIDGARW